MSAVGGYIRGPWWRYDGDEEAHRRRCYVICWGEIVREPSDTMRNKRQFKFAVKIGRGAERESKYLLCSTYGDSMNSRIMREMEKGDIVLCAGVWTENEAAKTKKGIKKTYEMAAHFCIPLELVWLGITFLKTDEIKKILDGFLQGDADPFEWDGE